MLNAAQVKAKHIVSLLQRAMVLSYRGYISWGLKFRKLVKNKV